MFFNYIKMFYIKISRHKLHSFVRFVRKDNYFYLHLKKNYLKTNALFLMQNKSRKKRLVCNT